MERQSISEIFCASLSAVYECGGNELCPELGVVPMNLNLRPGLTAPSQIPPSTPPTRLFPICFSPAI